MECAKNSDLRFTGHFQQLFITQYKDILQYGKDKTTKLFEYSATHVARVQLYAIFMHLSLRSSFQ